MLITYHLITSSREKGSSEDMRLLYHRTVELFVESTILYFVSLIVFVAHTEWTHYHLEPVAEITGAVAPTHVLGHILMGFSRPYASWQRGVPATRENLLRLYRAKFTVTRTVLFVDEVRALASAPTPALAESAENAPVVSAVAEKCG